MKEREIRQARMLERGGKKGIGRRKKKKKLVFSTLGRGGRTAVLAHMFDKRFFPVGGGKFLRKQANRGGRPFFS